MAFNFTEARNRAAIGASSRPSVSVYSPGRQVAPTRRTATPPRRPLGSSSGGFNADEFLDRWESGQTVAQQPEEEQSAFGRGLGFLINNPLTQGILKPLEWADYGRRGMALGFEELVKSPQNVAALMPGAAAVSAVMNASGVVDPAEMLKTEERDAAGNKIDQRSNWEKFQDPTYGYGQIAKDVTFDDSFGNVFDKGVGFVGDVALDPLSYVGGIGFATKGASAGGRAAKIGLARQAINKARRAGASDDEIADLTRRAADALEKGFGTASKETLEDLGVRGGIRITGNPISPYSGPQMTIPGSERLTAPLSAARTWTGRQIGKTKAGRFVQDIRAPGPVEDAYDVLFRGSNKMSFDDAIEKVSIYSNAKRFGSSFNREFQRQVDRLERITRGLDEDTKRGITDKLENAWDDTVQVDGVTKEFQDIYRRAFEVAAKDYGLPITMRDSYSPHILTRDAVEHRRNPDAKNIKAPEGFFTESSFDESGVTMGRKFRKGDKFEVNGKEIEIKKGTIAEVNELFREAGLDFDFFETDPAVILQKYMNMLSDDVGQYAGALRYAEESAGRGGVYLPEKFRNKLGDETSALGGRVTFKGGREVDPGDLARASDQLGVELPEDKFRMKLDKEASAEINDPIIKKAKADLTAARGERNSLRTSLRKQLSAISEGKAGGRKDSLNQTIRNQQKSVDDLVKVAKEAANEFVETTQAAQPLFDRINYNQAIVDEIAEEIAQITDIQDIVRSGAVSDMYRQLDEQKKVLLDEFDSVQARIETLRNEVNQRNLNVQARYGNFDDPNRGRVLAERRQALYEEAGVPLPENQVGSPTTQVPELPDVEAPSVLDTMRAVRENTPTRKAVIEAAEAERAVVAQEARDALVELGDTPPPSLGFKTKETKKSIVQGTEMTTAGGEWDELTAYYEALRKNKAGEKRYQELIRRKLIRRKPRAEKGKASLSRAEVQASALTPDQWLEVVREATENPGLSMSDAVDNWFSAANRYVDNVGDKPFSDEVIERVVGKEEYSHWDPKLVENAHDATDFRRTTQALNKGYDVAVDEYLRTVLDDVSDAIDFYGSSPEYNGEWLFDVVGEALSGAGIPEAEWGKALYMAGDTAEEVGANLAKRAKRLRQGTEVSADQERLAAIREFQATKPEPGQTLRAPWADEPDTVAARAAERQARRDEANLSRVPTSYDELNRTPNLGRRGVKNPDAATIDQKVYAESDPLQRQLLDVEHGEAEKWLETTRQVLDGKKVQLRDDPRMRGILSRLRTLRDSSDNAQARIAKSEIDLPPKPDSKNFRKEGRAGRNRERAFTDQELEWIAEVDVTAALTPIHKGLPKAVRQEIESLERKLLRVRKEIADEIGLPKAQAEYDRALSREADARAKLVRKVYPDDNPAAVAAARRRAEELVDPGEQAAILRADSQEKAARQAANRENARASAAARELQGRQRDINEELSSIDEGRQALISDPDVAEAVEREAVERSGAPEKIARKQSELDVTNSQLVIDQMKLPPVVDNIAMTQAKLNDAATGVKNAEELLTESQEYLEELSRLAPNSEDMPETLLQRVLADDPELKSNSHKATVQAILDAEETAEKINKSLVAVENAELAGKGEHLSRVVEVALADGWTAMNPLLFGPDGPIIRRSLMNSFQNTRKITNDNRFWRYVDNLTGIFKTYATLTPGFHVRNALSASFMNASDGVPLRESQQAASTMWKLGRASKGGDAAVSKFFDDQANIVLNEETGATMLDAFDAAAATGMGGRYREHGVGDRSLARWKFNEWLYENRATRAIGKRPGTFVESSVRLPVAMDTLRRGGSIDEAMERATRLHFNYSETSTFDQYARRVIPFWTFMSRNLPLQISQMWTNPRAYAKYNSFVRNLKGEDVEGTPEYFDQIGAFRLGEAEVAGMPLFLQPDLPHTRLEEEIEKVEALITGGEENNRLRALSDFNPMFTAPLEYMMGRDMYTGRRFDETDVRKAGPLEIPAQLLGMLTGDTKETPGGNTVVSENLLNALQAINPLYARSVRLAPQVTTGGADENALTRQAEQWARTMGLPVRVLSPAQQESTRRNTYYRDLDDQRMENALAEIDRK